MQIDPLIPIIVAIIGLVQVGISLYAGKRQSEAVAEREETETNSIVLQSYLNLIEVLTQRVEALEKNEKELRSANLAVRERYDQLSDNYADMKANCREILVIKENLERQIAELKRGQTPGENHGMD